MGWPTSTARTRLGAAYGKVIAAGDPSYCTVKGILAAGNETGATASGQ